MARTRTIAILNGPVLASRPENPERKHGGPATEKRHSTTASPPRRRRREHAADRRCNQVVARCEISHNNPPLTVGLFYFADPQQLCAKGLVHAHNIVEWNLGTDKLAKSRVSPPPPRPLLPLLASPLCCSVFRPKHKKLDVLETAD